MDGSQKSYTSPSHTREQVVKMSGVVNDDKFRCRFNQLPKIE